MPKLGSFAAHVIHRHLLAAKNTGGHALLQPPFPLQARGILLRQTLLQRLRIAGRKLRRFILFTFAIDSMLQAIARVMLIARGTKQSPRISPFFDLRQ